jgi:Bacterial Ig-like domain
MATFTPTEPLSAQTSYVARLLSSVRDVRGNTLGSSYQWSFTTAADTIPPVVVRTSPDSGQLGVPLNGLVQAQFSENISPSSLTSSSIQLLDAAGGLVSGQVVLSSTDLSAIFIPAAALAPSMEYTVRLASSIKDAAGNPLESDYSWKFTTGTTTTNGVRIVGNYSDQAIDVNGDGLYDNLTLSVDVEVLSSHVYNLNARLLDKAGTLLSWQTTGNRYLQRGVHTLKLVFGSVPIRSNGVDGPYTIDAVNFYGLYDPSNSDVKYKAYQTYAYNASFFYSALTLGKLPTQLLEWNTIRENAFNLHDYTSHATLPTSSVTYRILINTDPRVGVSIDSDGYIDIHPVVGLELESDVMLQASDTLGNRVTSTFHISVQKPHPSKVVVPKELKLNTQESQQLEAQVYDQWNRLLTSQQTVTFETTLGRVSPFNVTTSTGTASTTLTAGNSVGTGFVTTRAGARSTLTRVQVLHRPLMLYPLAVHAGTVGSAKPGQPLANILQGAGSGNFGWMSWTGDASQEVLVRSLTPPGNSKEYVNPYDSDDHVLSVGDWVFGKPGVTNSAAMRGALDALRSRKITVPVWAETSGTGSQLKYRVTGFACVQITDYRLSGNGGVSAVYLGSGQCP